MGSTAKDLRGEEELDLPLELLQDVSSCPVTNATALRVCFK